MSKRTANILAIIGFIIVWGAMGYDDTMIFSGQFYPFAETVKHMMFGCLFFIPRLVIYGKEIA